MLNMLKRKNSHKHRLRLKRRSTWGTILIFKCSKKRCGEEFAIKAYRIREMHMGSPYRESDRVY